MCCIVQNIYRGKLYINSTKSGKVHIKRYYSSTTSEVVNCTLHVLG